MTAASSGGSAAAGGFRFETQVAAYLAAYAVAERPLPFGFAHAPWPSAAGWPTYIGMQSGFPVDDVAAFTQTGVIVIQAKKGLNLSIAEDSALADALLQAVRMFRAGCPRDEAASDTSRDWNPTADRIVIATDGEAPKNVRVDLARVVGRLATAPTAAGIDQLANNAGERTALERLTEHLRRLWITEAGAVMTSQERRAFFSVLRIVSFDLFPSGRDHLAATTLLGSVLVDQTRTISAWNALVRECQDLASDRRFTTPSELRGVLGGTGIGVRIPTHPASASGPVYEPDAVLHGPLTAGTLHDRLSEAEGIEESDPSTAATAYATVMADLEEQSFGHVASDLASKLARALRASGKHRAAVDAAVAAAWRPLRIGDVPSAFPEAWHLQEELRKSPEIESLNGKAVLAVLQYESGQVQLAEVIAQVMKLDNTDDYAAELVLWCGEEAIAAGQPTLFAPLCNRATELEATISPDARELAGRLRICVAEVDDAWDRPLATIEADFGAELLALAHARRGQALAWKNRLADSLQNYEKAIAGGATSQMYAEVRSWLYDRRMLSGAWKGPRLGHDPHFTAQSLPFSSKISTFAGEYRLLARGLEALQESDAERAYRVFVRLRHRAAVGASMLTHRRCLAHLGDAAVARQEPAAAVAFYLQAGDQKKAIRVVDDQPDEPLAPDNKWFSGSSWTLQAAYAFLGEHGDLVPEAIAQPTFEDLANRLVTSGTITGWSNYQANDQLVKALASLVWASSLESAESLLQRTATLTARGRTAREHVDLVLGCARVHPALVPQSADQFCDLIISSEIAIPAPFDAVVALLDPARERLTGRLLEAFRSKQSPWLAQALVELSPSTPELIEYATAALDRATKPREYDPHVMSFGSDVGDVARLSPAVDPMQRTQFVEAMLTIAQDAREPHSGRREAIDAIAVLTQRCGLSSLNGDILATTIACMRKLAASTDLSSQSDDDFLLMGTPAQLMLAATRLLLILGDDEDESNRLMNTVLLTLMDADIHSPRLVRSTLAQAPAALFRRNLLVLATSRSPAIRVLAAHRWVDLPDADPEIGRRLARDPIGSVRRALAYSLSHSERSDIGDIRQLLIADCRFSVRTAADKPARPEKDGASKP